MEHFIKTAFWIVTLSGCLQARVLPIYDFNINEFSETISNIRTYVICDATSVFYTPTIEMISECNFTSALDCVMKELNGTVKDECTGELGYVNQALEFLDNTTTKSDPALINSTECKCEQWPETPLNDFLDKTLILLEYHKTSLHR